jgi:fatty acid desaturase
MSRDYDITGPNAQHAIEAGLVTPAWYRTDIERPVMKALMKRSDQPALRDTILLFSIMGIAAFGAITLMPSWWSLPLWLIYGVMYGSAMDSRWHECG